MSGDWFQVSFDQYLCKCTLYVCISVEWLEAVPILVYVVTLLLTVFPLKSSNGVCSTLACPFIRFAAPRGRCCTRAAALFGCITRGSPCLVMWLAFLWSFGYLTSCLQFVLPVCSCCRRLMWQSCLAETVSLSGIPGGHHAIVTPAYTSACQLGTCDIQQDCTFYVVHLFLPSGEQATFIWPVRLTLLDNVLFVMDMGIAMLHAS